MNKFPGKSKINPLDKSLAKPKTEVNKLYILNSSLIINFD